MWVFARTAREWCSSNQRGSERREDERIEERKEFVVFVNPEP